MNLFVPGRLCLFGEHTDWAGTYRRFNGKLNPGKAIVVGTNQGIYARAVANQSRFICRSVSNSGEEMVLDIPMEPDILLQEARKGEFFSYMAGVAYQIATHYQVRGIEIDNYKTDLPVGKGLSSSAAICVLTARAFNRVYDLRLTTRGEMEYAYRGEITTPSRCGRLDQACAYGNRPVTLSFDGDYLEVEEIKVGSPMYFVIVELGSRKDTIQILADLNSAFPFATNKIQRDVQYFLGKESMAVTSEAIRAIQQGDVERLGQLMNKAQMQFDRYCAPASPEQLSSPVLHSLFVHPGLTNISLGMKGVGSQGDGSAQILVANKEQQSDLIKVLKNDLGLDGIPLDIGTPAKVRKAVIPAAGFGTRLFPATKGLNKEFFPVVDKDGTAKPIIQLIVEEALGSGIEEVAIVVRPEDKSCFEEFFHQPLSDEHRFKLKGVDQDILDWILDIGSHVTFIEQEAADGLGHAVHCASKWVGDEPFVLLLGDHLYRSMEERLCTRQLLDAYSETGTSVVGIQAESADRSSQFGCVSGKRVGQRLLTLTELAEKPDPAYVRDRLSTDGLARNEVYTVFGIYVLNSSIFVHLKDAIDGNLRTNGEIQLTTCLDTMRVAEGINGFEVRGRRYDIGVPEAYLETLSLFGEG